MTPITSISALSQNTLFTLIAYAKAELPYVFAWFALCIAVSTIIGIVVNIVKSIRRGA